MRVAFAGNQNNYPFVLARAMRRAGHDVLFVVDRPERLNRPEARYEDVGTPYPDWIVETEPIAIDDVVFRTARWERLLAHLATADALVLNSVMFAAAADLDRPAVCVATGSDLEFYANPDAVDRYARMQDLAPRSRDWYRAVRSLGRLDGAALADVAGRMPASAFHAWRKWVFRRFVRRQRAGFARARAVAYLPPGMVAVGDRLVAELRPDRDRLSLLMTDTVHIAPAPLPRNPALRVFNSARLDWAPPFPPAIGAWENKGGDILIEGVALLRARTAIPIELHLVAKGHSVADTRALVQTRGLECCVTWHEEMTQQGVFEQYRLADVVVDQLGSHMPGMSTLDAMALGRPVLANGRPEMMTEVLGAPLPIAHARTPAEVAAQLEQLALPVERQRLALRGRAFAERHLTPDLAAARVVAALAPRARAA